MVGYVSITYGPTDKKTNKLKISLTWYYNLKDSESNSGVFLVFKFVAQLYARAHNEVSIIYCMTLLYYVNEYTYSFL